MRHKESEGGTEGTRQCKICDEKLAHTLHWLKTKTIFDSLVPKSLTNISSEKFVGETPRTSQKA